MSEEKENTENPLDVNGDGVVDAKDVAEVANAAAAEETAETTEEETVAPAPEAPVEEPVTEAPAEEENTTSPAEATDDKIVEIKGNKLKQSVVYNRRRG